MDAEPVPGAGAAAAASALPAAPMAVGNMNVQECIRELSVGRSADFGDTLKLFSLDFLRKRVDLKRKSVSGGEQARHV